MCVCVWGGRGMRGGPVEKEETRVEWRGIQDPVTTQSQIPL